MDAVWFASGSMRSRGERGQERTVLQRIRDEFEEVARPGGKSVSVEDLARHWERLAEDDQRRRGLHRLGAGERRAVALRVVKAVDEVDLQNTGSIQVEHWLHYKLLRQTRTEPEQVNSLLRRALLSNRRVLVELQEMFEQANTSQTGVLSFKEVARMYEKKLWRLRPGKGSQVLSDMEIDSGDPEKLARDIIRAMSLEGEDQISYAEFMAYCVGRRKQEVLLYMYDLSNGAATPLAPWLIGDTLEGVWHTGVVVYGKEYYYSKDTVFANPGETSFGTPDRVVNLGSTLWRQDELHEFVTRELKPVFQRETYDVVCNNCNHFSDRVCMFLVRKHVPQEVLRQPDLLLQSNSVSLLRPALNWYLRDRIVERDCKELPPGKKRLGADDKVTQGQLVNVHPADGDSGTPALAQVCPPPAQPGWDKTSQPQPQPAPAGGISLAGCGPGSLLFSTCGLGRHPDGEGDASGKCAWIKLFDAPGEGTAGGSRARVRTEQVHRSRLSMALLGPKGEFIFSRALKAMSQPHGEPAPPELEEDGFPRSAASRGPAPRRVSVPNCMSDDTRSPPQPPMVRAEFREFSPKSPPSRDEEEPADSPHASTPAAARLASAEIHADGTLGRPLGRNPQEPAGPPETSVPAASGIAGAEAPAADAAFEEGRPDPQVDADNLDGKCAGNAEASTSAPEDSSEQATSPSVDLDAVDGTEPVAAEHDRVRN